MAPNQRSFLDNARWITQLVLEVRKGEAFDAISGRFSRNVAAYE
jgi:hypothetical protein